MGKRSTLITLAILVAAITVAGAGCAREPGPVAVTPEPSVESSLQPVHPDEPASVTFNERFSLDNSLTRIGQLRDVAPKEGEEAMAFGNWLGAIEGTLRKQDYLIKKAEFELAKVQLRDKQISQQEHDQRQAAFKKAESDFKVFWEQFGIGD